MSRCKSKELRISPIYEDTGTDITEIFPSYKCSPRN